MLTVINVLSDRQEESKLEIFVEQMHEKRGASLLSGMRSFFTKNGGSRCKMSEIIEEKRLTKVC